MKKTILLIIILFIFSCEKDDGDSYSKDLISNWEGTKINYSYNIASNSSQTVTNPYEVGSGSIELSGAEEASLNYMYLYQANGVLQIAIAKRVFGVPSEETNYLLNIYDYGDFGSYSQLTKSNNDAADVYEGELEFTVNGPELTISTGALYHETVNDSVMISGTLAVAQETVNAGSQFEIGNIDWVFGSYEITLLINNDKSFEQTINTLDSETLKYSGTWDASSDEITFHYTNYSKTYEYRVSSSDLELTYLDDLCVLYPDECLTPYELMYNMAGGSLERVVLYETTFFDKKSD